MVDLVINLDDNFISQACVLVKSFFINGVTGEARGKCTIHVLSNALSAENKEVLSEMITADGGTIRFYELGNFEGMLRDRLGTSVGTGRFSVTVLARIFAAELLPGNVEKFLYLDCDMIVRLPLEPLFGMELSGNIAAACAEPTIYADISKEPYFNSGMMLIDRREWLRQDITAKCVEYLKVNNGQLSFVDQDILNHVLFGKVRFVSQRWNFFSNYFYETYEDLVRRASWYKEFVTKEDFDSAKKDPAVVHFAGGERPWLAGNHNPYRKEYEQELARTPFAGKEPVKGKEAYLAFYHAVNVLSGKIPGFRALVSAAYRNLMK